MVEESLINWKPKFQWLEEFRLSLIFIHLVFENYDDAVFWNNGTREIQEQIVENVEGRNFHGTNDVFLFEENVDVLTPHVLRHNVDNHVSLGLIPDLDAEQ